MPRVTKAFAKALAYRWGDLKERHPHLIRDLMTELTAAFAVARKSGHERWADHLDEVLDILAGGIVRHEHPAGRDLGEETLERAIAGVRAYYYLESDIPKARNRVPKMLKKERKRPGFQNGRP